jgi:hypothetical protein
MECAETSPLAGGTTVTRRSRIPPQELSTSLERPQKYKVTETKENCMILVWTMTF